MTEHLPAVTSDRRAVDASGLALALAVLAGILLLPGQVGLLLQPALPVIRLWFNPEAQHRLQLGDVPYDLLVDADALLPRGATVLLVTPGLDVRHQEYITFHRALYYLAPRPVWWLAPAPSDGTWEATWWISAALTPAALTAEARAHGATYILATGAAAEVAAGRVVATWPQGVLRQLAGAAPRDAAAGAATGGLALPYQVAAAAAAFAVLFTWGAACLDFVRRLGYRPGRLEAAALAWPLGAGVVSLAMLWLNAAGLGLSGQVALVSAAAIVYAVYRLAARRQFVRDAFRLRIRPPQGLVAYFLVALIVVQVGFVLLTAAGQPLHVWDSWASWGLKSRTIFLEGGITPAVYADPSRASTHPYYPLLLPLVEAWLYAWLGTPDDRLVGLISVLFFLSLLAIAYVTVRRWQGSPRRALAVAALLAGMPRLAMLAGLSFADLPLALFITLAGVYFVSWLVYGSRGRLALAVLAAGLAAWTKREGLVYAAVLAAVTLAWVWLERRRVPGDVARRWWARAPRGVLALGLGLVLVAGPWWVFVTITGAANLTHVFLPVTLATVQANLDRIPVIARVVLRELAGPQWSLVWPLGLLLVVYARLRPHGRRTGAGPLTAVWPLSALGYLAVMAGSYLFSAYVPYRAHLASSFFRLVAHVVPLLVLWIGLRNVPERAAPDRA